MKKIVTLLLALALILDMCACAASKTKGPAADASQGPTWQEQYDLGVQYLSEGNYEEAIIAFTEAIEIDPKHAPAYVGRGDAYVASGEAEENLAAALADYEKAIELDETNVEAYLGLANVYAHQGEYEKALEVLKQGLEYTNNDQRIIDKISETELNQNSESWGTKDFDDFSPEQKQYIENLVSAVEANDRETAWALLKEYMNEEYNSTFMFHGCRVKMIPWSRISTYTSGGVIEIHPRDGHGYFCEYIERAGSHFNEQYMVGECEDWNWNGPFEHYWRYYYADDSDTITVRSGLMRDGLLDGNVKDTAKRTYVGKNVADFDDWEQTYDEPYDMGVMVRFEDSTVIYSATQSYSIGDEKNWDWRLPQ